MPGTTSLYLVRHAHAGDPAKWSRDDALRPLSAKGRAQAERLAAHLAALRIDLQVILTSPKVRARETADPIGKSLGVAIAVEDRLAGGLTMAVLEHVLTDAGNPGAAMIVGHDPDFSELATELSGAPDLPLKKGALIRFDVGRPLREAGAVLRWLIPPDALAGGTGD